MDIKNIVSHWSVSRKLTSLVIACAVTTGIVVGYGTSLMGSNELEASSAHNLSVMSKESIERIDMFFKSIQNDIESTAKSPVTLEILNQFHQGWQAIDGSAGAYLQEHYVRKNKYAAGKKDKLVYAKDDSYYSQVHRLYHKHFTAQKDAKGYYDIFLINELGDIVYSVYKQADFATNMLDGQWSETALGKLFQKAKKEGTGQLLLSDFAPYQPSDNGPASFMLAPIYEKGIFKGAIAYQLPIDKLNTILQLKEKTISSYLVGQDGILRSDNNHTKQDDILKTKVKIDIASIAGSTLDAQEGLAFTESLYAVNRYDFNKQLSLYSVFEKDVESIHQEVSKIKINGFILAIITSLLTAVAGFFVVRKLSKPLLQLSQTVDQLSRGYIVDVPCTDLGDEIGNLARSMQAIHKRAIDSARIETAIEGARASFMIADVNGQIIYNNNSIMTSLKKSQDYLRKHMPKLDLDNIYTMNIGDFHGDRSEQIKNFVNSLKETYAAKLQFDDRYFDLYISPVYDKAGMKVGFVTEWDEKTEEVLRKQEQDRLRANEEMIEAEIAEVIQSAAAGNFQVKLNTQHDRAFVKSVAVGINQICEAVDSFFNELNSVVSSFADGDLTKSIRGAYAGQFDDVKHNLNGSFRTLSETIKQITTVGNGIHSASADITQGADDLSSRTESQAASIEETVATMEEISASVRNNANSAVQAASLAADTLVQAEEGSRVVAQAVTAMKSLENSSHRIAEIVSVIDSIASQTNLLALNAAVEAARAGEAGKGFSVVASEVRTLASRCSDAARDIRGLIAGSNAQVIDGVKLVDATGTALRLIVESVTEVSQTIASISAASREQATGVEEISGAITQMDETTQQNASLSDESAAAARSLAKEAEHLAGLVRHFKTEDITQMLDTVSKDLKSAKEDLASLVPQPKKAAAGGGKKESFDDFGSFGSFGGDDWADL